MKKFILILMLATFMLVPNVNAEEVDISCSTSINLMKPNNFIAGVYKPFNYSPSSIGYVDVSYASLIPVEPSATYHYQEDYYFSQSPRRIAIVYYDDNFQYIKYINFSISPENHSYDFTTLENARYITLHLYMASYVSSQKQTFADTLNSVSYQLMQKEEGTAFPGYVDYEECPVITADTTLDNFYSVYVSKLKEFSEYALENKYILGTLAIILLFIILEIILNLFRKGGFR